MTYDRRWRVPSRSSPVQPSRIGLPLAPAFTAPSTRGSVTHPADSIPRGPRETSSGTRPVVVEISGTPLAIATSPRGRRASLTAARRVRDFAQCSARGRSTSHRHEVVRSLDTTSLSSLDGPPPPAPSSRRHDSAVGGRRSAASASARPFEDSQAYLPSRLPRARREPGATRKAYEHCAFPFSPRRASKKSSSTVVTAHRTTPSCRERRPFRARVPREVHRGHPWRATFRRHAVRPSHPSAYTACGDTLLLRASLGGETMKPSSACWPASSSRRILLGIHHRPAGRRRGPEMSSRNRHQWDRCRSTSTKAKAASKVRHPVTAKFDIPRSREQTSSAVTTPTARRRNTAPPSGVGGLQGFGEEVALHHHGRVARTLYEGRRVQAYRLPRSRRRRSPARRRASRPGRPRSRRASSPTLPRRRTAARCSCASVSSGRR